MKKSLKGELVSTMEETNIDLRLDDFTAIMDLLACPGCSGRLSLQRNDIVCLGCNAVYPVHEGVPLLARFGSTLTENRAADTPTSELYQKSYLKLSKAADYNLKYKRQISKRMSTQRERRILRSLLASQGHCKIILDLPCGGGRLSDQLATATDLLIEADIAIGQILYGRDTTSLNVPRLWMTASAFHIPFCDNAVDATVCIRLNHHLPSPVERERLVRELLRVSSRFVIMTFFDYHSFKNLFRRVRQPFNHKRAKNTMSVDQIGGLARANNAALVACPQLSTLGSGHRYALLVKSDP